MGLAALHLRATAYGVAILQHSHHLIVSFELIILAGRGDGNRVPLVMQPSHSLMGPADAFGLIEEVAPVAAAVFLNEFLSDLRRYARQQRSQHLVAIHSREPLQFTTGDLMTGFCEGVLPAIDHLRGTIDKRS